MIILSLSNDLLSSPDFGKTSNLLEILHLPQFHLFIIVKTYNDTYFNVYIIICVYLCVVNCRRFVVVWRQPPRAASTLHSQPLTTGMPGGLVIWWWSYC